MAISSITLFVQCLVDAFQPRVGEAMVTVLRRLNLSVDYPQQQTCCGQPALNAGFRSEARSAARRFIEIFEKARVIVCPSGSCVHTVRHHYPLLFQSDPQWLDRARQVGYKTYEFSQFLVDVLGVDDVGARFRGRLTYHDSCHLSRGLGVREQPRRLLRRIRGIDFVEMEESDRCCGFGGSFAFKYPAISEAMLQDKIRYILDSGADTVVGCDTGCLMNIQGMLSRSNLAVKTLHITELLARGLE
jgi:L-lactate dehydrogenase complex protein LldE